jgi:hypothetical protein
VQLVTYLLSRRLEVRVDPVTENIKLILQKVVTEQVVLRIIRISPVIILPKFILIFNQTLSRLRQASKVRENSNKQCSNEYRGELERKVLLNGQALRVVINHLNTELNPICHLLILLGDLKFTGPCIVSIFQYIYPTRCNVTQFIYIWKLLYMFRAVLPLIIRRAYNCIYSI